MKSNWLTLDYGVRFVHAAAAARRSSCRRQLPAGQVGRSRGAGALRGRLRERRDPCTGTNRQAMNPLTGQLLGPNSHARDRHARAELRQRDERPVPVGPGHRRNDLHVADAERRRRASAWPTT